MSSTGNALIGAYMRDLGLNDRIIAYTTEAAPTSVKWLTDDDARSIDLIVENVDEAAGRLKGTPDTFVPHGIIPIPALAER